MNARGAAGPIKVLIVDDSAIVRKILTEAISAEPDMIVIGTAPDPYVARDKILALRPDVLTLDIEMPRMDGLTFLKRLMLHHPIPTIIISSLGQASCSATLEALRFGAVDVLAKPAGPYSVGDLRHSLAGKIRAASTAKPRATVPDPPKAETPLKEIAASAQAARNVIAIGASTGGTVAIQELLLDLPTNLPGIVITQHIPAGFSLAFANRLNKLCRLHVKEAEKGDLVQPGHVLIAPGDYHMVLRRQGQSYVVDLQHGPQVCYQRPSVDVMFTSVAQAAAEHSVAILLTGMGADGARGMLAMKRAGATTIAQDESSCVVYGMPREAVRLGAADTIAPLHDIARLTVDSVQKLTRLPAAH